MPYVQKNERKNYDDGQISRKMTVQIPERHQNFIGYSMSDSFEEHETVLDGIIGLGLCS